MNRLFIIIAAIGAITGAAFALRKPGATSQATQGVKATAELPTCCQKAPSRASLLVQKPRSETTVVK